MKFFFSALFIYLTMNNAGEKNTTLEVYPCQRLTPNFGAKFVTLTLKPKWYKKTAVEQLRKTRQYLIDVLQHTGQSEGSVVAELTQQGNIHYHMWICCREMSLFLLIDAWRKIGFSHVTKTPVKNVESIVRVSKYMDKQRDLIEDFFKGEVSQFHFKNGEPPSFKYDPQLVEFLDEVIDITDRIANEDNDG